MDGTEKEATRLRRIEEDAAVGRKLRSIGNESGIMRSNGLWLAHKTFISDLTPFEALEDALDFIVPAAKKSGGLF